MHSKADLLLHPVRLRIAQVLTGRRQLTAQQIAQTQPKISQASLYRHLNLLVEGGVLTVVQERPVQNRNLVEKVYAIDLEAATLHADDIVHATRVDHLHYFTMFITMLLADFERYLQQKDRMDLVFDEVEYEHNAFYLSDEEMKQLLVDISALLKQARAKEPSPERRLRYLSLIAMPAVEEIGVDRQET